MINYRCQHITRIFLRSRQRILGRVVKALDLSLSGLSPRGFEPRRMHFWRQNILVLLFLNRKFGRVVKALALGASLERGVGSIPTACSFLSNSRYGQVARQPLRKR